MNARLQNLFKTLRHQKCLGANIGKCHYILADSQAYLMLYCHQFWSICTFKIIFKIFCYIFYWHSLTWSPRKFCHVRSLPRSIICTSKLYIHIMSYLDRTRSLPWTNLSAGSIMSTLVGMWYCGRFRPIHTFKSIFKIFVNRGSSVPSTLLCRII